jgi:hypothetical protein
MMSSAATCNMGGDVILYRTAAEAGPPIGGCVHPHG